MPTRHTKPSLACVQDLENTLHVLSIPHTAPLDLASLTASPHLPTTRSIQSLATLAPSPSVATDITTLSDIECVLLGVHAQQLSSSPLLTRVCVWQQLKVSHPTPTRGRTQLRGAAA